MPYERPEYVVYGPTPDKPLAFTLPPVEAQPNQPLPDAGPFLRVCAGAEEPTTALLRCARQLVGEWRHVHEYGRSGSASVDEQLNLLILLIDREAGGHTSGNLFEADAPISPSSYGVTVVAAHTGGAGQGDLVIVFHRELRVIFVVVHIVEEHPAGSTEVVPGHDDLLATCF
jgi:hypothetical protein